MQNESFPLLLVHKDHLLSPDGVNAGAETAVLALARALRAAGREVCIAAKLPPEFAAQQLSAGAVHLDGVRYLDLGQSYDTSRVRSFVLSEPSFQSCHVMGAGHVGVFRECEGLEQVRSRLFLTHEPSVEAFGVPAEELGRWVDCVICVSEAQRQLVHQAGCPEDLLRVIPNGADLERFRVGEPGKRDWGRLAFVGALVLDKGVHLLVEAFTRLKGRFPNLQLDIYGSAGLWGRENYFDIESVAKALPGLNLHGAVTQEELARVYREAGLLVQPSIFFESFGLSVVEAQVSGMPAVGSGLGGMREIIDDGVTGRLLYEFTPEALEKCLFELLSQPELLEQMSRKAVELKRPQFSWARVANQVLELVASVEDANVFEGEESPSEKLQRILAEVPIEELFPRFDWKGQPESSAGNALLVMSRLFQDAGDAESAAECLQQSLTFHGISTEDFSPPDEK